MCDASLNMDEIYRNLNVINLELKNFGINKNKRKIILFNKIDLIDENKIKQIKNKLNDKLEIFFVSCFNDKGINNLVDHLFEYLKPE